jgi:hypothetical protein
MHRVGQNLVYGVYGILAGKSPNIRSCTVFMYGSGQPEYGTYCSMPIEKYNALLQLQEATVQLSRATVLWVWMSKGWRWRSGTT